jgi:hypothetical protein
MPELNLQPLERIEKTNREDFYENFIKPNKPVIITDFAKGWPALDRWSFDYFKKDHADLMVPVFKEAFANTGTSYISTENKMRFGDYLDIIANKPSLLRMFLFNIFKHIPDLCDDFSYPDLFTRYLKKYPFMFFGGATSWVDAHYDLDLSHVILTQFTGRKRIVLYGPENSDYLYRHALTVSANIDIGNPDFDKYPRLAQAKGYDCTLNFGETLFIPTGYWHYVYYTDGGFSLSVRARPEKLSRRLMSLIKIFNLTVLDHGISKILGAPKWYQMKEDMAQKKAKHLPSPL